MPVPVIAALRGITFGGGFQIAMGADIRISAHDLQMSVMEIKWGLIPDMGISMTLPGVMPQDKAKLLAYTGRVITADEALELCAVTILDDDPLAAAMSLARDIAAKSPDAIRAIKTLMNSTWTSDPAPGLHLEAALHCRDCPPMGVIRSETSQPQATQPASCNKCAGHSGQPNQSV